MPPITGATEMTASLSPGWKDADVAPWFYSTMQSEGLKISTLTLLWDETNPTDIPGATSVTRTGRPLSSRRSVSTTAVAACLAAV